MGQGVLDPWADVTPPSRAAPDAPPSSPFMSNAQFRAALSGIFPGGWTDTGDYRSKAREDQLRAQGAGTVAPGHVSAHSLGTEDAPGAHDIVAHGMSHQEAAARLAASGLPIHQAFAEGAHGGQGGHVHVSMAPGGDPYAVADSQHAPAARAAPDPFADVTPGAHPDPFADITPTPHASPKGGLPLFDMGFHDYDPERRSLGDMVLDPVQKLFGAKPGDVQKKFAHELEAGAAMVAKGLGGIPADVRAFYERHPEAAPQPEGIYLPPHIAAPTSEAQIAAERARTTAPFNKVAAQLEAEAATQVPQTKGLLTDIAGAAGGAGSFIATGPLAPLAMAAANEAQVHDDAARKGYTGEAVDEAALGNALWGAGLGSLPIGAVLDKIPPVWRNAAVNYIARIGLHAAGGAALGGAMQGTTNLSQSRYDPYQDLTEGMGGQEATMAAFLGAHAVFPHFRPPVIGQAPPLDIHSTNEAQAAGQPPPPPPGPPGPGLPETTGLHDYMHPYAPPAPPQATVDEATAGPSSASVAQSLGGVQQQENDYLKEHWDRLARIQPNALDAAADQARAQGDLAGAVGHGAAATQARLDAKGAAEGNSPNPRLPHEPVNPPAPIAKPEPAPALPPGKPDYFAPPVTQVGQTPDELPTIADIAAEAAKGEGLGNGAPLPDLPGGLVSAADAMAARARLLAKLGGQGAAPPPIDAGLPADTSPPKAPVSRAPTPDDIAKAADIAGGVPPGDLANAQADVAGLKKPIQGVSLLRQIASMGGVKLRYPDGRLIPGPDLHVALDGVNHPGVVNNQSGMTPENMVEALAGRGWLGAGADQYTDHYDPNAPDLGEKLTELLEREVAAAGVRRARRRRRATQTIDITKTAAEQAPEPMGGGGSTGPANPAERVYHPESTTADEWRRRHRTMDELERAGVEAGDHPIVQAAKLAAWRHDYSTQEAALDALRQRADDLGITYDEHTPHDELLGDVVEREAIRGDYADFDAQEHQRQINEHLTQAESQRLQADYYEALDAGRAQSEPQPPAPAHEAPPGYEPGEPQQSPFEGDSEPDAGGDGGGARAGGGAPAPDELERAQAAAKINRDHLASIEQSIRAEALRLTSAENPHPRGGLAYPGSSAWRKSDQEIYEKHIAAEQARREPETSALLAKLARQDAAIAAMKDSATEPAPPSKHGANWDAMIAEQRQRDAQAAEIGAAGKSVKMVHPDGRTALIGPDMAEPGMFRVTRFDKHGEPWGHAQHNTLEQAAFETLQGGYVPEPGKAEPATETVHLGDGKAEQGVMPGMEPSAVQAAQSRGDGGLKASRPQAEADGLFGPPPEPELFDAPAPAPLPPRQSTQMDRNYFANEAARRRLKGPAAQAFVDGAMNEMAEPPKKALVNQRGAVRDREFDGHSFARQEIGRPLHEKALRLQEVANEARAKWEAGIIAKYGKARLREVTGNPNLNMADELNPLSWAYGDASRAAELAWNRAAEYPAPKAEAAPPAAEPAGYGDKNTLVTKDQADQAIANLKRKLNFDPNQLNSGIDPTIFHDGMMLAVYHLEAGARSFADFAGKMLGDLGEEARPYLRMWYNGARDWPGFADEGMTPHADITPQAIASAGKPNVFDQQPDLEPGGGGGAPADDIRPPGVSSGSGGAAGGVQSGGGQAAGAGRPLSGGAGASAGGAPSVGEPGDHGVHVGQPQLPGYPAGSDDGVGGGEPSHPGIQPDNISAGALGQTAAHAAHVEPDPGQPAPGAASSNAPKETPRDIEEALPTLHPEQRSDVAFAEERFAKPDGHGVMFTNGTGTGKTFVGGGIIKRFFDRGDRDILVVAPSQGILDHWAATLHKLGVQFGVLPNTSSSGAPGEVSGTTYANLGMNRTLADRNWDLVVADEAHTLSSDMEGTVTRALSTLRAITNHPRGRYDKAIMILRADVDRVEALQAKAKASRSQYDQAALASARADLQAKANALVARMGGDKRTKAAFLSATPFAYDKSIELAEGYLFEHGPEPTSTAYNTPTAAQRFFMTHFGYRMRYGRLTKPDSAVESEILERAFHEWMKSTGALSGRQLNLPFDYDRKFMLINSGVGRQIDQALEWLQKHPDKRFHPLGRVIQGRFRYLDRMRLLEAIKAEAAVPAITEHMALGRKVVVFHDFNEGGGFSPFEYTPEMEFEAQSHGDKENIKAVHEAFVAANPYVTQIDAAFHGLKSPIETLTRAFPDALIYNGTVSSKVRREAIQKFQDDDSGANLIISQVQAGKQGISLHDTTGVHQRVAMILGMPPRPTDVLQLEGRVYRDGQASNAIYRYMNTGTNWERNAFAQTIASRSGTAENLAMGDRARTMRESMINAFLDSDHYPPRAGEGTGGKEADARLAADISAFQRARTFYFAQGRRAAGRRGREGVDYYATPEPLGLKMVQWADIKPGDHVLEPSAGHGAIGRSFPETAHRTLIEPETELASRARLAAPGANVKEQRFEDLHPTNKYDAIVMNPPFGHAGATAIDHLARAASHLRNGGRIVALLPRGATDAKLAKFLESDAAKNLHQVGDIDLPTSTFERAGTKVSSRVVILEKQIHAFDAGKLDDSRGHVDFSNAENINELFDRIEHYDLPDRVEPSTKEELTAAQQGEALALTNHADVVADANKAAAAAEAKQPFTTGEAATDNGEAVHFATANKGMSRAAYSDRMAIARRYGGTYMGKDRAQGTGLPTGFHFAKPEHRDAFVKEATTGEATPMTGAMDPNRVDFRPETARHRISGRAIPIARADRVVSRPEYERNLALAQTHGGRWSGDLGVRGFQFPDEASRDRFIAASKGEGEPAAVTAARAQLDRGLSGQRMNAGLPLDLIKPALTLASHGLDKIFGEPIDRLGDLVKAAAAKVVSPDFADAIDSLRLHVSPMSVGSERAKAAAKEFANARRRITWEWGAVHIALTKQFTPEQRERMWSAADAQSVAEQQGLPDPPDGLASLAPEERAAVADLIARSQKVFELAKQMGMTNAEGLPSYVPRMVIAMSEEGPRHLKGRAGSGSGADGRNLITTTGNLRQRRHLEVGETEEAAQHIDPDAMVVKDIRTLALATGQLEAAIAGRHLVESVKAAGEDTGSPVVHSSWKPGTFTLNHPAFRSWHLDMDTVEGRRVPRTDQNGRKVFSSTQFHINKEFEGPLRAVLSTDTARWITGTMQFKARLMKIIMLSPLMHNAVIWGKAIPADPIGVLTGIAYFRGHAGKKDVATMRRAIGAGMDPIGKNFAVNQDILGIARADERADTLGTKTDRFLHNTLLWDRVADLQMGLYLHAEKQALKHGFDAPTAGRIAADMANLYAGSLPVESMSKAARVLANLSLFSRSFTLGNLALYKRIGMGLPSEVQAQIMRDSGAANLSNAQGYTRRKAAAALMMDVAIQKIGLVLAAHAAFFLAKTLFGFHGVYQAPSQNEPGKKDRALIGYQSDKTGIYIRLPTGKFAEDMVNWITHPVSTLDAKLSPFGKWALEVASNSTAPGTEFGKHIWQRDAKGFAGNAANLGNVAWAFAGGVVPSWLVEGLSNTLIPQHVRAQLAPLAASLGYDMGEDKGLALAQTFLPIAGITVSKGAPGGPVMASYYQAKDAKEEAYQQSIKGINAMARDGDIEGARKALTAIGVVGRRQAYAIRAALTPQARFTPGRQREFNQMATPEQRAAMAAARARAAQILLTPSVSPAYRTPSA